MIEFSERNVNRAILTLAWPAILENVSNTAVFLIDSVFVGRLGTEAFAAVGQTTMLLFTITFALSGIGIATGAMVARNIGRQDQSAASEAAGQGLLLGALVGVLLTAVGIIYSRTILTLLDTPSDVIELGTRYLQIVFAFSLFRILSYVGAGILRAAGDTKTPMWSTGVMNLVNVIGDWVLIFGIGPFPQMGTDGAALATGLAFLTSALIILYKLFQPQSKLSITWPNIRHVNRAVQKTIIRISLPSMGEQFLFQGAYWIFMWIVTSLGTIPLAAHFMAVRVEALSYMPAYGLSTAVATLVGQSLGAGRVHLAELVVRRAIWMGMIFMVGIGALFVGAPGILVDMFSPRPEVYPLACLCVQIAAFELPGDTLLMMCMAAMRGAGDTITPLIISLIGAVILRIGVIYLFVMVYDMGLPGVWYGTVIDWTMRGLVGYALYRRGRWKRVEL